MGIAEFDGRALEGVFSGNARIRWGKEWSVEGEVRTRGVNVGCSLPRSFPKAKSNRKARTR
jgi:hypothetical protein